MKQFSDMKHCFIFFRNHQNTYKQVFVHVETLFQNPEPCYLLVLILSDY